MIGCTKIGCTEIGTEIGCTEIGCTEIGGAGMPAGTRPPDDNHDPGDTGDTGERTGVFSRPDDDTLAGEDVDDLLDAVGERRCVDDATADDRPDTHRDVLDLLEALARAVDDDPPTPEPPESPESPESPQ